MGPVLSQVDDRRPQITGDGLLCLIAVALVVLLVVLVADWRRGRRRQKG
jgi:hypothetical protein